MSTGLIPEGKGEVTHNALLLKPGIKFEQWEAMGDQLGAIAQGVMFWVGDWLCYGEEAFGEKYAQAIEITGYSYRTVKQAKYIAKKFPPGVRDERLTFTHYTAVAGEEPEKALQLLEDAAEDGLTVEELKRHRRGEPIQPMEEKPLFKGGETHTPAELMPRDEPVTEKVEPEKAEQEPVEIASKEYTITCTCPHCKKTFDVDVEL